MVAIQFVSGISSDAGYPTIPKKADILAIVGNFGRIEEDSCETFLISLANNFQTVLIVPGNQDYYSKHFSMEEIIQKISSVCQKHTNLILLNNKSVVIDNIKFIGSTLWPMIPKEHANVIQSSVADFSNILIGDDKHVITVRDYNKLHKEDVSFVSNEIMTAKSLTHQEQQHVVVLSHFSPSGDPSFLYDNLDPILKRASFTDLEHTLGPPVDLWIFGHTNKQCNITTSQGTVLASNPASVSNPQLECFISIPIRSSSANVDSKTDETTSADDLQTSKLMDILMKKKKAKKETSKRKYFDAKETDSTNKEKILEMATKSGGDKIEYTEEDELESYLKDTKQSTSVPVVKKQKDFKF